MWDDERTVVSICGPSGAGKSQLAKAVVAVLGDDRCGRIPGDNYLMPANEPLATFLLKPLRYDWELISRTLQAPIGTQGSIPVFDFDAMTRVSQSGGKPFEVRQIMVIDAMYPYPSADVTILLTAPDDERRSRLVERDRRWESRVIDRWDNLEISRRHLEEMSHSYHLILDGTRPLIVNARLVASYLSGT